VIDVGALGMRWLRLSLPLPFAGDQRPARTDGTLLRACPHCTNVDTLSRHCANPRCGWVACTCGALIYSRRSHRHPRHGSDRDTCHDPSAAV
jgi:hypothetical protein